jgi:hypothetical protein
MRSHWFSFATGALFGSATVVFWLAYAASRRGVAARSPAVTIDDVRPPDAATLALQSPPEVTGHDFPLESESSDIAPGSQRW